MSKHRELGLTDFEYDLIVEKLEREPNEVELAVFSLMWSEHCGYKHSRRLLKSLPTEGPRLVLGPGENAGAVSVGDGLACAFKVESHNHPSAVEPFEGAATGVGGILRDIFAIGARPIAILDSLRFGEVVDVRPLALPARARGGRHRPLRQLDRDRHRRRRDLLRGPVRAELPGQRDGARADRDRQADPVRRRGRRQHRRAVRRATGRDGIGGASVLASAELDDVRGQAPDRADRRPVHREEAARVLAGAARSRVCWSRCRTSAPRASPPRRPRWRPRARSGSTCDVRRVPLREAGHGAVRDHGQRVAGADALRRRAVAARRGAGRLRALGGRRDRDRRGHRHAPPARLRRRRAGRRHAGHRAGRRVPGLRPGAGRARDVDLPGAAARCCRPTDPGEILLGLLGSANLASRKWAFEQYDSIVGSRTVRRPEQADAAVLLLPDRGDGRRAHRRSTRAQRTADGPRPAIAVAIDGNGRRVAADPYRGAVEAVARVLARTSPASAPSRSGLTNCLNFGNPEKPHIAWQLTRAIAGLGDACRAFGIPVVGGNVSLYNEGGEGPIYPTPVVGLVGELPDARRAGRLGFVAAGDAIASGHGRLGAVAAPLRSSPSCAARPIAGPAARASTWASSRRCTPRSARPSAAGTLPLRARRRRGWRRGRAGRVPRWPPASARRCRGLTRTCSAKARARSWSPARPRR